MSFRAILAAFAVIASPCVAVAATPPCLRITPDQGNVVSIAVALDNQRTTYQWTLDGLPIPDTRNRLRFQADSFREPNHSVSASSNGEIICASDITVATLPLQHVPYQEAYPPTRAEKLRQQMAIVAGQVDEGVQTIIQTRQGNADLEQDASERRQRAVNLEEAARRTRVRNNTARRRVADALGSPASDALDADTLCSAATDPDVCQNLVETRIALRSQIRVFVTPLEDLPPAPPPAAPAAISDSRQYDSPQLQSLELEGAGTERQRPTEDLTVAQLNARLKLLKASQLLVDGALASTRRAETQRSDELNAARTSEALAEARSQAEEASLADLYTQLETLVQMLNANTAALNAAPAATAALRGEDSSLSQAVALREPAPSALAVTGVRAFNLFRARPLPKIVKVFYVTERQPGCDHGELTYLPRRTTNSTGKPLYGVATVSIPPDHVAGNIELPAWYKFERHPDRQTSFTIGLQPNSEAQFYHAIQDHLSTRRKEVFVFVHGFNNSFDDAILRTAQLANDIGFDGAPITYDWPSHESLLSYGDDKNEAKASFAGLEAFLNTLSIQTGATTINVIAHSMGNFVTMNALNLAIQKHPNQLHLNQLILAAPDIERVEMDKIMPRVVEQKLASRITLYASHADWAMVASNFANSAQPVGGTEPFWTAKGVETIDASRLEDNILGHDYFATTSTVLNDIYTLITSGTIAMPRKHMTVAGAYWVFDPGR